MKPHLRPKAFEEFVHGERIVKTPELARKWAESFPVVEVDQPYVVFKPLTEVGEGPRPEVVNFLVDADRRLSALSIPANYGRDTSDKVILPNAAGCQSIAGLAYVEARRERPRAVVGLTDLTARDFIARKLGRNPMSFAIPWALFGEMEAKVEGSFLERPMWQGLLELEESQWRS